ncbi:MAG: deoxyribose-phosphate aldolase [Prevotellaceae bacterium]|jgi:deoxyribose-phosphate aldolase|nr:deoxyribose-phosphate aldolase [Prevotellaceae bacterium]
MSKFEELFKTYSCNLTNEQVKQQTSEMLAKKFDENNNIETYKKCLSFIDLTSLNGTDTQSEIATMTKKVNDFDDHFPHLHNVAAVCVYPSLVPVVKGHLTESVGIAAVAAGFPASQTFLEVKIAETAMSVLEGASEIDVVISLGEFLDGNYRDVYEELSEIKAACRSAHLKVILETGALQSAALIKKASLLAMAAKADFIKTSTGKIAVSATPEAAFVMCGAISEWYAKTGVKVGYKAAGGISTPEEAVKHYTIVKEILGNEWLNKSLFRFGASRLANKLLTAIEGREVEFF